MIAHPNNAAVRPRGSANTSASREEVSRRKRTVSETLRCPHCDEKMNRWEVPETPFTEWDASHMYICFNDSCPYLLRGWEAMTRQRNRGLSYRQMYHPDRDCFYPAIIRSLQDLRDHIVE